MTVIEQSYTVFTEELQDRILAGDKSGYIFLDPHPTLPRQFRANSFDASWRANFQDVLGYDSDGPMVSLFHYDTFAANTQELGYKVVFFENPEQDFEWLASLNAEPEVELNSDMAGTINGLLPFQVQGYNMLKQERAGFANWSTGTGKTAGAIALTLHHDYDLCIWVVKTHNRINTARSLKRLGGLDSIVIDGTKAKRQKLYAIIDQEITGADFAPVVVTNYEKFREDSEDWIELVEGRRVFVVYDEMPTKLRNRGTKLYRAFCKVFYTSETDKGIPFPRAGYERPSELRSLMLSATPIENKPDDLFNCVRLMDPTAAGSIKKFEDSYVVKKTIRIKQKNGRYRNIEVVDGYKNLHRFAASIAHLVHQVDKSDPDIAAQFPAIMDETLFIDLSDRDRKVYDKLLAEFLKMIDKKPSELDHDELLAAISVFQMLCDNPVMVLESAKRRQAWEDRAMAALDGATEAEVNRWVKDNPPEGSEVALKLREMLGDDSVFTDADKDGEPATAKLEALRDILDGNDGEKALIFATFNETGLPHVSKWLTKWDYDHVVYHGGMSQKQKQEAEDRFKSDPDCKVFLSSDSGSDSINLEVANLIINYNLPWKWSTLQQRQNRLHRITSTFEKVRFYTLAVTNSIEDRKRSILDTKYGYHEAILKGEIADVSEALRSTGDLLYILTGKGYE